MLLTDSSLISKANLIWDLGIPKCIWVTITIAAKIQIVDK